MSNARHSASPSAAGEQPPRHRQSPEVDEETSRAHSVAAPDTKMRVAGFSRVEHLGLMIGIPQTDRYPRRPGFIETAQPIEKDGRRYIAIEFDSPRAITTPKNKKYEPGRYYGGFVGIEKDGSWKLEGPMTEIGEDLQEQMDPKSKMKVLAPRKGSVYRDLEAAGAVVSIAAVPDRTKQHLLPHIVISFPGDRVDQVVGALQGSVDEASNTGRYANRQEVMLQAINRLRETTKS